MVEVKKTFINRKLKDHQTEDQKWVNERTDPFHIILRKCDRKNQGISLFLLIYTNLSFKKK